MIRAPRFGIGAWVIAWWLFAAGASAAEVCQFDVVDQYPHDPGAFTQGLAWARGKLFESTGLNGQSSLREVDLKSGRVKRRRDLERRYFAEGLSHLDNALYQLTWKSEQGFVYDAADFSLTATFSYPGEGWGITHDGTKFMVSDGSAAIRFYSFDGFRDIGSITVMNDGRPLNKLNELEYVNGALWANIWQASLIAKIDPVSGAALAFLDVGMLANQNRRHGVTNGLAWDANGKRLFVTGKNWPTLYAITSTCF